MASETAVIGGGCFWCTEAVYQELRGVQKIESGYSGGSLANPTYEQVCNGNTGHVEVVEILYDPTITSFEEMLKLYYETHNFEQVGGQGPDIGSQYESVVFYVNEEQKQMVEKYIQILTDKGYKVATQLRPAPEFWAAEDYHQQYYKKKNGIPYCHAYKKIF